MICGKLYRRSCFDKIRYPEDNFVTYKFLFALGSVLYLKYPVYYYYSNPDGITKSGWKPGNLTAFEAYAEQLDFLRRI